MFALQFTLIMTMARIPGLRRMCQLAMGRIRHHNKSQKRARATRAEDSEIQVHIEMIRVDPDSAAVRGLGVVYVLLVVQQQEAGVVVVCIGFLTLRIARIRYQAYTSPNPTIDPHVS